MPLIQVDYDLVRQFVLDAEAADLFTESLTFEAKEKRNGTNVIDAVGALSNTDGGIVLVGVIDKGAAGETRIVGIPQAEHDALVNQMRSLIPHAMPEVIPVAKPGTDRLILVLRIDADAVLHPVVVNGRVWYRLPGQKAPADRQQIMNMIARDQAGQAPTGPMQIVQPGWRPQDIQLWPEGVSPHGDRLPRPVEVSGELRVVGGLTLPQRVLEHPWLDTRAKQATVDVLNNAPIRTSPSWALQTWQLTEARSGTLSYESAAVRGQTVHAEARAHLRLAGRYLALLVAFRWLKVENAPFRLGLDTFHDALMSCMVTAASTCAHVTKYLDAAAPTEPRTWEAWLFGAENNVFNAVDIGPYPRDNEDQTISAFFPPTKVPSNDLAYLERTARDWLMYWLLEIGTSGFEQWLAKKSTPQWLRWPELV